MLNLPMPATAMAAEPRPWTALATSRQVNEPDIENTDDFDIENNDDSDIENTNGNHGCDHGHGHGHGQNYSGLRNI